MLGFGWDLIDPIEIIIGMSDPIQTGGLRIRRQNLRASNFHPFEIHVPICQDCCSLADGKQRVVKVNPARISNSQFVRYLFQV